MKLPKQQAQQQLKNCATACVFESEAENLQLKWETNKKMSIKVQNSDDFSQARNTRIKIYILFSLWKTWLLEKTKGQHWNGIYQTVMCHIMSTLLGIEKFIVGFCWTIMHSQSLLCLPKVGEGYQKLLYIQ